MKTITNLLLAVLVAASLTGTVCVGQTPIIKVSIAKEEDRNRTGSGSGEYSNERSIRRSVSFNIQVSTMATKPIPDAKIKWTVLVDASSGKRVFSGEKKATLSLADKVEFKTDAFEFSDYKYRSHYSGYKYESSSGDVKGCLVQVFIDDKLVAEHAEPPNIKRDIQSAMPKEGKEAPKRHSF